MKSILLSIKPKYVKLIANGEKTIEVRKSRPKLEVPFKCYIYCTKGKPKFEQSAFTEEISNGKVIGEFVCDKVFDMPFTKPFLYYGKKMFHSNNCCKEACLSYIELEDYLDNKDGFGWHISNLKIYDKPKELSEFKRVCNGNCQSCQYAIWQTSGWVYEPHIVDCQPITRPPQSWCYVEEVEQ